MKYKTPNNFGKLIIQELEKQGIVSGEAIYDNIAKRLKEEPTLGFAEPIRRDLAFLVEKGKIARYSLYHPQDQEIEEKVDSSCPEFFYKLIKS